MNPYFALRDRLGLSVQSGTSMNLHWLFLTLNALGEMEEANPTGSAFADPAAEVMYRLRNQPSGFGMQELSRLLGA